MKPLKVGKIASGVALLGIALGSAALTLGRTQSVAWVGKPLDVQIQVQSDRAEDLQPDCLAADVLYGEAQLDPARVSVTASAAMGSGGVQSVRVLTTVPIDEPVVTVQLRVGCQQKLSKRYTLFAELPTSVVEPVSSSATRNVGGNTRASPAVLVAKAVQGSSVGVAANTSAEMDMAPVKKPRPVKLAGKPTLAVAIPAAPRPARPSAKTSSRSRLKLDALDLLIERDPVLRASTELLTLPQEDGAKRAEAATLWRSLNLSPEQLLQEEAKSLALESDIKSLHAVTAQNAKGLVDLAAKLQQTESERYANGLVYSLIVLGMFGLLTFFWFWRRNRVESTPDWLHGLDEQDSLLAEIVQAPKVESPAQVASAGSPTVSADAGDPITVTTAPLTEVDLDLDFDLDPIELLHSGPVRSSLALASSAPAHAKVPRDFSPSISPGMRSLDSEELVDVREQAEFFMSLGQHDRAIDILTTRVAQCGESSPLVCLDLLKIYHALGRETDFEFMRTEFNHWFAAHIPEFSAFGDDGRALDQYPQIMERISVLWPSPAVLEYIEACLYHHADEGDGVVFDLQAYLDLLFLHGVAKQMVRQTQISPDAVISEALRIPARAGTVSVNDEHQLSGGPVGPHRAGAHYRGSQFGAMKYPPTTPSAESTVDLTVQADADPDSTHTDFNFLGLR